LRTRKQLRHVLKPNSLPTSILWEKGKTTTRRASCLSGRGHLHPERRWFMDRQSHPDTGQSNCLAGGEKSVDGGFGRRKRFWEKWFWNKIRDGEWISCGLICGLLAFLQEGGPETKRHRGKNLGKKRERSERPGGG